MNKHLMAVGAILSIAMGTTPAFAAKCAKRDKVVERLKSKYFESFAGAGLQATQTTQNMVEVWASHKTGTFTVILTTPEGLACVVATGTDWYQAELTEVAEGTES